MAVNTVSTFAIFQSTINDVNNTQTQLANLQNQLSSGQVSQNFQGLGSNATQYLNLGAEISKATSYINNNTQIGNTLTATDTQLQNLISQGQQLASLISTRETSTAGSDVDFSSQFQQQWQAISGILNTNTNGQYIFSGAATGTPTVNQAIFPSLNTDGVPDADYYQGSNQDLTVQAQDNDTFTYNVRGDAPAMQQLIAGLVMAQKGSQDGNEDELTQASDLVQKGLEGITTIKSTVEANNLSLTNTNATLTSFQTYWKNIQQTIGNTNLVSVSTQVAVDQGILQAAFQAFAKINSLSLSSFLPNG